MTTKRLSDLVREEVDRESTPEADPQPEVDVSKEAASQTEGTKLPSLKTTNLSRLTKAQLEVRIKELAAALTNAQQQENSRQNQLETLESELNTQKEVVQTLQTQQQQSGQLETELEEQKQLVQKLYAQLQQVELEKQEVSSAVTSQELMLSSRSGYGMQRRPIGPSQPVSSLSNEEIGWFD